MDEASLRNALRRAASTIQILHIAQGGSGLNDEAVIAQTTANIYPEHGQTWEAAVAVARAQLQDANPSN